MDIRVVFILLMISGCTTTPQGKSIDRSNYADLGSTWLALSINDAATEANPLGIALIPIKLGMGKFFEDRYSCESLAEGAGIMNSFYYGATGNNLAVAFSIGYAPVIGVLTGVLYYAFREDIEPKTFECGQ